MTARGDNGDKKGLFLDETLCAKEQRRTTNQWLAFELDLAEGGELGCAERDCAAVVVADFHLALGVPSDGRALPRTAVQDDDLVALLLGLL